MMKKVILILSICVLMITVAGCASSDKYTLKQFNQIQTGMSYSQCASIMGSPGVLAAESTMPGVPGIMETITFKIYGWQNENGSNLSLTFENDRLNMKAQAGLK